MQFTEKACAHRIVLETTKQLGDALKEISSMEIAQDITHHQLSPGKLQLFA